MQIDNDIYFGKDLVWWDDSDDSISALLRHVINPLRFACFRRALAAAGSADACSVLDVGCGGGFLSEELAKSGYQVTGVDPSPHLVQTASEHAARGGLAIRYLTGYGERLPFADACFDCVACCDVLEHVDDVGRVVAEIARVLKPGGMFLFDTINRSWLSWLFVIKVAQDWKHTAWEAPRTHVWSKFIKPKELMTLMAPRGLVCRGLRGIAPTGNPLAGYRLARRRAKGLITRREMATQMRFGECDRIACSYMGVAAKAVAVP